MSFSNPHTVCAAESVCVCERESLVPSVCVRNCSCALSSIRSEVNSSTSPPSECLCCERTSLVFQIRSFTSEHEQTFAWSCWFVLYTSCQSIWLPITCFWWHYNLHRQYITLHSHMFGSANFTFEDKNCSHGFSWVSYSSICNIYFFWSTLLLLQWLINVKMYQLIV